MSSAQTSNEQTPLENKPVDSEPEAPPIAPKRSNKKWWLVAAILLILAAGGGLYWYYFANKPQPAPQNSTTQQKTPTYSRLVLFSKNFSVEAYSPDDNKVTELYKATDAESKLFCEPGCSGRTIALSPDYSKVAFDSMVKDGKAAFGYYDRATNKVTVLANGERPSWSPDGKRIAYADQEGVHVMTLADGAVITIDNTKPQPNKKYGTAFPVAIFGWRSNTEVVFDLQSDPDDIAFNIGDTDSKANHGVTLQGITPQDSMRGAVLSPDGSKMLVYIDKDPGYSVALVNVDGTGLADVTGNLAARWPGSGYSPAAFSPDGQTMLIANVFIPANPSAAQNRATGELEAHDTKGQKLFTITGHRVVNGTYACWYDAEHIYGIFQNDQSKHYLGVYDKVANKVTELDSTVSGIGLSSLTCAK